jgi:signal transduction histidine kinase
MLLRVLIAEDDTADAELLVRELKKSGYEPRWHRVDTEAEFRRRLAADEPDIIIADHAMPQFSSADALRCLDESGRTIPFIIVSHAIGEEEAVALIRAGAADYLMKDRLGRLGEAIRHALAQRQLREEHAAAQRALLALNADLEKRVVERTAELQALTRSLEDELRARQQAEAALQRLNLELEQRIDARTRDLVASQGRLRALASELSLTEQRERKRLAAELHDHLAQMLVLCRLKLGQYKRLAGRDLLRADIIKDIEGVLGDALAYTRTLVADLAPPVLHDFGLPTALKWLSEYMARYEMAIRVDCDDLPDVKLGEDDAVLLFQSARELLMNCRKHAEVQEAAVSLRHVDGRLLLQVRDQGKGFDPDVAMAATEEPAARFGLFSIRERMRAVGGTFEVDSAPGRGTTATLSVPFGSRSETGGTSEKSETSRQEERSATPLRAAPASPATADSQTARIRVLLVDDHAMVRQGLRSLMDSYAEVEVVGEASNGEEAVQLAQRLNPSLVVMDINMPKKNGIEATSEIKANHPHITVIGLSVNAGGDNEAAMREAGASLLLTKEAAVESLYGAILDVVKPS